MRKPDVQSVLQNRCQDSRNLSEGSTGKNTKKPDVIISLGRGVPKNPLRSRAKHVPCQCQLVPYAPA